MAYHSTALAQFLKLVPRLEFEKLARAQDGARRSDALSRWSQFTALVLGHIGRRHSLRDIETALATQPAQRYHLGIQSVSRSALARANEQLHADFFQQLFYLLYQRCQHSSLPSKRFRFKGKLFSLDGSLIDLSMKVFPWADIAPKKAAFKLHVGLDHDGLIPAFAEVSEGLESEMAVAGTFRFPPGSVLVFDRGYGRYAWHKQLTDRGLFWVTRARSNMKYEVVSEQPVVSGGGVISDQIIRLTGAKALKAGLDPIRRVEYRDAETNKHYVFLTNQRRWAAQTVADIYKSRWEVELFFKWIKQNLKIRSVIGHSINAVASQVFVALCVYLLLSLLKCASRSALGIQAILRLLQTNLFARRPIEGLLRPPSADPPCPQLALSLRAA
ncbi:MAG: IS4 family transposase [Gammaproteobacteria bacterium]|nr:IS4 family transposase [Gammaproteobacteria bacterium]